MLISSVSLPPYSQSNSLEDRHLLVVEKMVKALADSPHSDQIMDGFSSEDFGPSHEVDNEVILSHAQKDLKYESLARQAPSKRSTKTKKEEAPR